MCADLEELPWDDVAIAGAITELTALLVGGSPQVSPVSGAPGMWWVGASGFGRDGDGRNSQRAGERALAYTLRRIAARWHPQARVAIADSCVAARAATWAGTSFQRGGDERSLICIVPPGRDAEYLAPAPLVLVPMEEELREALGALGLRSVGALAALAAEDVERRWGDIGLAAWRLARGEDRRRPVLARVAPPLSVELELPASSATMEPVLFLVRAALDRLVMQLVSDGRAAAAVAITLTLDDARSALPWPPPASANRSETAPRPHTITREVRPAHPLARVSPLLEHCRTLLDSWTLSAPVSGVTVSIVATTPISGEQGNLLDSAWRDPAAADAALARLRAELGPNVVVKPVARDAFVPERAGAWQDSDVPSAAGDRTTVAARRQSAAVEIEPTLRLLEQPASVFVDCDGDVPQAMTWQNRRIAIARAVGPERLSGDWWSDGYQRDYWRCESSFGDFVLYLDRAEAQWMLQGWYD